MKLKTGTQTDLLHNREEHGRSFLRAVSWRAVGTVDAFMVSFFVTSKVSLASGIASLRS